MVDEARLPQLHRRALDATGVVVDGVTRDQWDLPTPCTGWDVATLLNHVIAGNWWAAELAAGATIESVGDRLDGDVIGDDAGAAYRKSAAAAAAVFEAPGAMEAPCAVSYGPVPGSVYAGHRFVDVLLHGWDLAVASGQYAHLDPELAAAAMELLSAQEDMVRSSGLFGEQLEVPANAGAEAKLLAFVGRRPT
jgi:uncharacterized protein (TIGR03086 family)